MKKSTSTLKDFSKKVTPIKKSQVTKIKGGIITSDIGGI